MIETTRDNEGGLLVLTWKSDPPTDPEVTLDPETATLLDRIKWPVPMRVFLRPDGSLKATGPSMIVIVGAESDPTPKVKVFEATMPLIGAGDQPPSAADLQLSRQTIESVLDWFASDVLKVLYVAKPQSIGTVTWQDQEGRQAVAAAAGDVPDEA